MVRGPTFFFFLTDEKNYISIGPLIDSIYSLKGGRKTNPEVLN